MNTEQLSLDNIEALIGLVLELWGDCDLEEEYEHYKNAINSGTEICFLVKEQNIYIAFIHLSIRNDYVEGADELPVAYIEGIYVKPYFQKKGIAKSLISAAEIWAKQKGLNQIASDTDLMNSASIEFHNKVGFKEVERIVCFIKDI